ncbi:MAG TPA: Uma2 family endonuclease [Labilithrix sp.]
MQPLRHVAAPLPRGIDQRVHLVGLTWRDYEAILAMRGESSAVRIAYLRGTIEITSPSSEHEEDKKRFARLVEAWSEEAGIDLDGIGSLTIKKKLVERGVEPDECYIVLARHKTRPKMPDFAIEVVRTSGGIDKLEIYRLLGVREVWFWENGALGFHVLRGKHYVRTTKSTLLPSFDPALVTRFMRGGTQPEAVRGLRRALRKR